MRGCYHISPGGWMYYLGLVEGVCTTLIEHFDDLGYAQIVCKMRNSALLNRF